MALRPLKGRAKRRRIAVYDGEWVPGNPKKAQEHGLTPLALRLFGFFDGRRYQHFTRVPDFLNAVCTRQYNGYWFFAHAGGLADLIYLFQYLVDNQKPYISISCQFSGGSAIIVKITKGFGKHALHWYFVDSFWLIRQPLREVAKWVGMAKGGASDSIDQFYVSLPELRDYNENDCRILHKALSVFEESILGLGGELQRTIASTAMNLFRRRFLTHSIEVNHDINEWAFEAYFASRVEVLRHELGDLHAEPGTPIAKAFDINSSFPYAMTFDAPGNMIRHGKYLRDGELGIARAKVSVPHLEIPPLPYRGTDHRVYFPVGTWEGWFSNVDLQFLERVGGKILDCRESIAFEPIDDLKAYAETVYDWRRKSSDEALKVVLKFLLNSLYGKFGEGKRKTKVLINPDLDKLAMIPDREPGGTGKQRLMPGVWSIVEDRNVSHAHVPIAVHITALARKRIGEFLLEAQEKCRFLGPSFGPYYCDTDSLTVPAAIDFPTSDRLGDLKYEAAIYKGSFAAPKLYAYYAEKWDDKQAEHKSPGWIVKGKGFSRVIDSESEDGKTHPFSFDDYCKVVEHKDLHIEQFVRLRTLWGRYQSTEPRQDIVEKTWWDMVRPKRARYGEEGQTRPWTVAELSRPWQPPEDIQQARRERGREREKKRSRVA